jgi:WS/DGAT/MGAT family acyltransferase
MDAAFLYMETPATPMHVAFVAVLDPSGVPGGVSFEDVRRQIRERAPRVEPFTRVARPAPLQVHHPVWMPVEELDVDAHLDRVTLRDTGDPREFGRAVGAVLAEPLDRSRPLWHATVVEGLPDGRLAIVLRVHHALMDGVGGIENLGELFDLEPSPAREEPVREGVRSPGELFDGAVDGLEHLAGAVADRARSVLGVVPLLGRTLGAVTDVALGRSAAGGRTGGTPLRVPSVPFTGAVASGRLVGVASVPLDDVAAIRAATGLTANEALLAICSRTLRRYLQDLGVLPRGPLMASCPVSTRSEDERHRYGNRLSVMFTKLHTEVDEPAELVAATKRSTRAARLEHRQLGPDLLAQWAEAADPRLVSAATDLISRSRLADRVPAPHNLVFSTIPGPPMPVYLAGARVERAYPFGALFEGSGLTVTTLTYADSVDVGVTADPALVPDPQVVADGFAQAATELRSALS